MILCRKLTRWFCKVLSWILCVVKLKHQCLACWGQPVPGGSPLIQRLSHLSRLKSSLLSHPAAMTYRCWSAWLKYVCTDKNLYIYCFGIFLFCTVTTKCLGQSHTNLTKRSMKLLLRFLFWLTYIEYSEYLGPGHSPLQINDFMRPGVHADVHQPPWHRLPGLDGDEGGWPLQKPGPFSGPSQTSSADSS